MKRMKKLFAILMTMAMVMGLGITAMADTKDSATITVQNAESATLEYAQIITPDRTEPTGWAFVNDDVAEAFLNAFEGYDDDQELLGYLAGTVGTGADIDGNYAQALSNVIGKVTFSSMAKPQTVNEAGVYMIKATEVGYTYGYMAAYVGFGEVTIEDTKYDYPSLLDANVIAKKTPTTTTKTENVADDLVEVGTIVTYTVEANVPYFDSNDQNKTFSISDVIEGANYYLTGENAIAKVEVEGISGIYKDVTAFAVAENGKSFNINLNELVADGTNRYAGNKVTVTYTAKVTGTPGEDGVIDVNNTASTHVGDDTYHSDPVTLYTAQIKMIKKDKDDQNITLEGAGFKIYKVENGVPSYAKFDDNNLFVEWVATENDATEVFTGTDGTVTVKGLDQGTYYFKETTAPEGYSVNAVPEDITVSVSKATETIERDVSMLDTKLAALPSTGGMGTTIFTIAGCVIMISAAGLFFASRRKAN